MVCHCILYEYLSLNTYAIRLPELSFTLAPGTPLTSASKGLANFMCLSIKSPIVRAPTGFSADSVPGGERVQRSAALVGEP